MVMTMRINEAEDLAVASFTDWFSFVDKAVEADSLPGRHASTEPENSGKGAGRPFYGIGTMKKAQDLAERGWSEGAARVASTGEALYDSMSSLIIRPVPFYSDEPSGDFDIPRLILGEPEYWLHVEDMLQQGASRNILRMVFNASADAGVTTDVMMAKGAIVAALVMLLERAGFGVEVVLFCGMQERVVDAHPGARFEAYTTVKQADQPLHLLTLAYALAHPSTFRRFAFGVAETLPESLKRRLHIPGFYGYPTEASHTGDVYIPSARYGFREWGDASLARKWVLEIMRAQGVLLHA